MGMFDYIMCEYPLPGQDGNLANTLMFQTKDLDCFMKQYSITVDGRIYDRSEGAFLDDFTGAVDISYWNVTSSGPGLYTKDGEDAHSLRYRVLFVDGKVHAIKETENKREPAAKRKYEPRVELTDEKIAAIDERQSRSYVGKTLFCQWGGCAAGYPVTVIAENTRELVCQWPDGVKVISRAQLGATLFNSEEDSKAYTAGRAAAWAKEKAEYDAEIAAKAGSAK